MAHSSFPDLCRDGGMGGRVEESFFFFFKGKTAP